MKKKDFLLFSILFLIIFLTYIFLKLNNSPGGTVLIQNYEGDFIRLPLSEDKTIEIPGPLGKSVVEIKNRKVRILSSPCPDKLCVKQGYISESGQVIICLPNRVVIKIEGRASFDALTY